MERAALARRPDARDPCAHHRWVELAFQDRPIHQIAVAAVTGKHELGVPRATQLAPPGAEHVDRLGGQVDIAPLVALRLVDEPVRPRSSHAGDRADEIDVPPREGD
jgi:hypothetical protein